MRRGPKPAKSKEAKPPVPPKSSKDEAKVHDLEKRLAEALRDKAEAQEQLQTRDRQLLAALDRESATSEILRVIRRGPTDTQPVFDAILEKATRLVTAENGILYLYDGEAFHVLASRGLSPEAEAHYRTSPARPGARSGLGRMRAEKRPVQIADITDDEAYRQGDPLRVRTVKVLGARTAVWLPLLKGGETVVGALGIYRHEVRPFTDEQIRLVATFADQAVIAIENVRLFTELQEKNQALTHAHAQVTESLEQQTATSEILRVISSSPTDIEPVLRTIVQNAQKVCGGYEASVFLREGNSLRLRARQGGSESVSPDFLGALPVSPGFVNGRAVLERRVVQVADLTQSDDFPEGRERARQAGYRTNVAVPLMREGEAIGTLAIRRGVVAPFTDAQLALLQTFADQAVIAIENVRLFNETKEALERQTATAEILGVISRTPTDVQPVFEAIVESAVRLCDGLFGGLVRFDGDLIYPVATHNYTPEALDALHRVFPTRPSRTLGVGRAILDRDVVHIPDVELDPEYRVQRLAGTIGFRSGLFVPMLLQGTPIGAILVARAEPGPFPDRQIALLRTFADQAVMAIENVRLFKETKEALDQQTATADILRVISSSPTDVQPV